MKNIFTQAGAYVNYVTRNRKTGNQKFFDISTGASVMFYHESNFHGRKGWIFGHTYVSTKLPCLTPQKCAKTARKTSLI